MFTQELESIIRNFVGSLVELVETDVIQRVQNASASVFAGYAAGPKRKRTAATAKPPLVARPARRVVTITPKLVQARKLQGQYMAAVRGLKPEERKRVNELTREKGAAAGLVLARSLGGRA